MITSLPRMDEVIGKPLLYKENHALCVWFRKGFTVTSHHARIYIGQPTKIFNTRRCFLMSSDTNSLAHTKWNCKYHIVFAPKYRRQVIYGKIKRDIGVILRQLCERKGVEIIEAEACKDHISYVS